MAKLDSPLYGDTATGTLARVLAYRRRLPIPSVAQLPNRKSPPSSTQAAWRANYRNAVHAWNNLTAVEKDVYTSSKPANLTAFNFFMRLNIFPGITYFGFAIFGSNYFQLAPGPGQPAVDDYTLLFPSGLDEFPSLHDGSDSPQAWLYNMASARLEVLQATILQYAP